MSICAISECNDYSVLQEMKVIPSEANTYKIRGSSVLQTLDEINGNRRLYTHAIGEIYVDSANKKIQHNRLLGELDHPWIKNPKDPGEVKRQMMVLWERVSHKFNRMWIEHSNILCEVETLSNNRGIDLARIANIDGVPIGFSCRAVGKVKPRNINGQSVMEVVQPTLFVTYDAVTDPSHKTAELTDISEVITNASQMNKFKTAIVSENETCIDESNELFALSQLFIKESYNPEPVTALIESFIDNRAFPSADAESRYVQGNMARLLGSYLASSDRATGVSQYGVLNESNVHSLMTDYAYNHGKKPYQTVRGVRAKIDEYLG